MFVKATVTHRIKKVCGMLGSDRCQGENKIKQGRRTGSNKVGECDFREEG